MSGKPILLALATTLKVVGNLLIILSIPVVVAGVPWLAITKAKSLTFVLLLGASFCMYAMGHFIDHWSDAAKRAANNMRSEQ